MSEDDFTDLIQLPAGLRPDQIISLDFDCAVPVLEKDGGAEIKKTSQKIVDLLRDAIDGSVEALAGLKEIDPLFDLPRVVDAELLKAETERLSLIDYFASHGQWTAHTRAGAVVHLPLQSREMLSRWLWIPQNEKAVRSRINVSFPIQFDVEDAGSRH